MQPSSPPEIKRLQLGQTVLKLLTLGVGRPDEFDYIESPGRENIMAALSHLSVLEAIIPNWEAQEYRLTPLGAKMARLPVDPRLAKLLLLACEESDADLAGDALIVAALATIAGSVFFRMGGPDDVQLADQLKIQFCEEWGDFVTMLELYRAWAGQPDPAKSAWCTERSLNAKSMRIARDVLRDIKAAVWQDRAVEERRGGPPSSDRCHRRLSELLFQCYRQNLCVYSGHPKTGYINLHTGEVMRLHPSTCLFYLGNVAPQFIVYDQVR